MNEEVLIPGSRIDAIGQNGATGEHYVDSSHYNALFDPYWLAEKIELNQPQIFNAIKYIVRLGRKPGGDIQRDKNACIDSLRKSIFAENTMPFDEVYSCHVEEFCIRNHLECDQVTAIYAILAVYYNMNEYLHEHVVNTAICTVLAINLLNE